MFAIFHFTSFDLIINILVFVLMLLFLFNKAYIV